MAEKFRKKTEGQLAAGTYEGTARKSWADFRAEWEEKIGEGMLSETRRCTLDALAHFERLVKPKKINAIKSLSVDHFIAKRRKEKGRKKGSVISPATVNKELRHLKTVLRVAVDWGYLVSPPKFRMIREPQKLIRYVTPEHFAAIYSACDVATRPANSNYTPGDWWRALLAFIYMTGWRVSEPLALKWDDVSLDEGKAITRWDDNKGKRDECVPLHPAVVEHLRKLVDFGLSVFPWDHSRRSLWVEYHRIQAEAGISPVYGFHDLRRAFATCNADRLTADSLQTLMRHKSYATTKLYINMSKQVDEAVEKLYVPDVLKRAGND